MKSFVCSVNRDRPGADPPSERGFVDVQIRSGFADAKLQGGLSSCVSRRPAGVVKTRSSVRRITSMIAAVLAPIYVNSYLEVDRPSPAGGPGTHLQHPERRGHPRAAPAAPFRARPNTWASAHAPGPRVTPATAAVPGTRVDS